MAEEAERDIAYDPEPIGRYNVAPGTIVLLLSERDEQLHLDPVHWSYAPGWWDKPPLINGRIETAATSRMFKPLWQHGRAICFADGWFGSQNSTRVYDDRAHLFIYRFCHSSLELTDSGKPESDINTLFSFLNNLHSLQDRFHEQFDRNISQHSEFKLLRIIRNYHHVRDVDEFRVYNVRNEFTFSHSEMIITPV